MTRTQPHSSDRQGIEGDNADRGGRKRKHSAMNSSNDSDDPEYPLSRSQRDSRNAQREQPAPTTPELPILVSFHSEPTVIIYLGSDKQQIPQSKFLSHVWEHGLDSPCMVCRKDFDSTGDPPIRTFAFETSDSLESVDITQAPIAPHPIRVFNRHFDCIKAEKVQYIPISHAWHHPVSISQQNLVESIDAARLVYQIPIKTLLGLTKKYGDVEIWHDYISVPQWHDQVHRQLLLAIPKIYAFPKRMVMHLDDVKTKSLESVQRKTGYNAFLDGISAVTKSRWFDRVWVTLEYVQGQEVSILSEDFEVFGIQAADLCERVEENIAKYTEQFGQDRFSDDGLAKGHRWRRTLSWIDMETWKTKDETLPKHRTFGGAVYILGQKECRDSHDYYFAIRGLLGLGQNHEQVADIVSGDSFHSYLSIAWQALENGDYTPLLLTPHKGEQRDPRAPWLRGHSHRSENLWDLGICHQKATSQSIIRDGTIKPELDPVGVIEEFEYYNFRENSANRVFHHVALKILRCSGTLRPKAFCDAVNRIFVDCGKKAQYNLSSETEHGDVLDDGSLEYDYSRVREILKQLLPLSNHQSSQDRSKQLEISQRLIEILGLHKSQQQTNMSRMEEAAKEAEWYQHPARGRQNMEGLARIGCASCGNRSLFRLSIWEAPKPDTAQVFRIPGLLYDLTVQNGVGLVVCNKRIIGKMAYGTRACECRELELVELS